MAAVAPILAAVAHVFTPIDAVFNAIANAAVVLHVANVFAPVTPVFAAVAAIFAPIADVLEPIQATPPRLGLRRHWQREGRDNQEQRRCHDPNGVASGATHLASFLDAGVSSTLLGLPAPLLAFNLNRGALSPV
jgi:hypothetical protein